MFHSDIDILITRYAFVVSPRCGGVLGVLSERKKYDDEFDMEV